MRQARDPIDYVKKLLIDYSLSTADEIKQIEKDIRNSVQDSLTAAKTGKAPTPEWLYQEIYAKPDLTMDKIDFIRMPDIKKSVISG